jgi:uncharacterized membrane protein
MFAWSLAIIAEQAPPALTIPSFGAAFLGWILSIALLLGPFAYMAISWQRRNGSRWSLFSQWRTRAFWGLISGSVMAAIGLFMLVGVIPFWQAQYATWHLNLVQRNPSSNLTVVDWNTAYLQQYIVLLQIGAAASFLSGTVLIGLGQTRLSRRMVRFRQRGPDDWLVASPDTGRMPIQHGHSLSHPFEQR